MGPVGGQVFPRGREDVRGNTKDPGTLGKGPQRLYGTAGVHGGTDGQDPPTPNPPSTFKASQKVLRPQGSRHILVSSTMRPLLISAFWVRVFPRGRDDLRGNSKDPGTLENM